MIRRSMIGAALLALMAAAGAEVVSAQEAGAGQAGPRAPLPRAEEIALARSAAPPEVSGEATILVWTGDGWETAVEGSNGATCYVARDWPRSLEPHCFDAEGSRTILPIHLKRMEWLHAGMGIDEVEAAMLEGVRSGRFLLPSRPAVSYMMSAGQRLVAEDGRDVGRWKPHLMIYFPRMTEDDVGGANATAVVVDPGSPFSNLMVPVESFIEPERGGAEGGG